MPGPEWGLGGEEAYPSATSHPALASRPFAAGCCPSSICRRALQRKAGPEVSRVPPHLRGSKEETQVSTHPSTGMSS